MPKIERYTRNQTIPSGSGNVKQDPNVAAAGGRAASELANTAFDIIAEHKDKLIEEDRKNKYLNIQNAFDEEILTFKQSELQKTGQDAYDNIDRAKEFRDQKIKEYSKDIIDPDLQIMIKDYISGRSFYTMSSLATHQAKERKFVTDKGIENKVGVLLKEAYNGDDLERLLGRLHETVALNKSGAEAEDIIMNGEAAIAEAHLDGIINKDPTLGIAAIESGTYDEYMPQEKIEEYDKKAKVLEKALVADQKAAAEQARKDLERAKREAQNETGNEFVNLLYDGKLTEELVRKSNLDPTGENSKQYWIGQIKDYHKKDKGDKWKTDPEVEAELYKDMYEDPEGFDTSRITSALGNGLSVDDAKGARAELSRLLKGDSPEKEDAAKAAIQQINYARTAKLFSGNKEKNNREWAKKIVLLKKYIKNNYENDKYDPLGFADQLLEEEKDSWIRSKLDWMPGVDPYQSEAEHEAELEAEAAGGNPSALSGETQKTPPAAEAPKEGKTYTAPASWLEAAKKANPDATEEELIIYYSNKYGNPE